jgi:hypothetical protein
MPKKKKEPHYHRVFLSSKKTLVAKVAVSKRRMVVVGCYAAIQQNWVLRQTLSTPLHHYSHLKSQTWNNGQQ